MRQLKRAESRHKPIAVVYYYYDYALSRTQRPTDIALCLLKQLYSHLGKTSHPLLEKLYTEFLDSGVRPDMEVLCSVFPTFISEFDSIFVFVDALDEYTWGPYVEIENLFLCLVNSDMKLFLTSRNVTDNFKKKFKKCRVTTVMPTNYDIELFLEHALKDNQELGTDFKKEIIDKLSTAAQGSYYP